MSTFFNNLFFDKLQHITTGLDKKQQTYRWGMLYEKED